MALFKFTGIKELVNGKFLGHPIHVMIIHFPMALFPVSFILQLLSITLNDTLLSVMAFYLIVGGISSAGLAAIFGTIDLLKLPQQPEILRKAGIHAIIMVTIVIGYFILAALDFKNYPNITIPSIGKIVANGIMVVCLFVAAHFGGDLIYKHKIGVDKD